MNIWFRLLSKLGSWFWLLDLACFCWLSSDVELGSLNLKSPFGMSLWKSPSGLLSDFEFGLSLASLWWVQMLITLDCFMSCYILFSTKVLRRRRILQTVKNQSELNRNLNRTRLEPVWFSVLLVVKIKNPVWLAYLIQNRKTDPLQP